MKRAILGLGLVAMLAFVSCKENASSKVKTDNVAVAAERDEAAKLVPVMEFEKVEHDFGTIVQGTPKATSSCGCTVPNPPKEPIAPGEVGELKVKFNGSGRNQVTKTITVVANTVKGSEMLKIKAFVNPKDAAPLGPVK